MLGIRHPSTNTAACRATTSTDSGKSRRQSQCCGRIKDCTQSCDEIAALLGSEKLRFDAAWTLRCMVHCSILFAIPHGPLFIFPLYAFATERLSWASSHPERKRLLSRISCSVHVLLVLVASLHERRFLTTSPALTRLFILNLITRRGQFQLSTFIIII